MSIRTDRTPGVEGPDLLAVVDAVRPSSDIDRLWNPREQAAVRERILTADQPVDELASRRGRRRRPLVVLAVSGLVVTGGAGAAAAGGLMPQAFTDAFSFWQGTPVAGSPEVDPSNAERVATAAGPGGTVFTVMTATAADDPDYVCTVALFETPQSAAEPGPADFTDASGNWCQQGPQTAPFGSGAAIDVSGGYYVWHSPAGDAVRAELHTASGQTYPVVRSRGDFFGWFPARSEGEPPAELIGYAADGTELGREPV
jgi:hypothetical protein